MDNHTALYTVIFSLLAISVLTLILFKLYRRRYRTSDTTTPEEEQILIPPQWTYGILRANSYTTPETEIESSIEQTVTAEPFAVRARFLKFDIFKLLTEMFRKKAPEAQENYLDDSRALPTEEERQVIKQFAQDYQALELSIPIDSAQVGSWPSTIINPSSATSLNYQPYPHSRSEPIPNKSIGCSNLPRPEPGSTNASAYSKRLGQKKSIFVKNKRKKDYATQSSSWRNSSETFKGVS